ncbi:protein disulfide-isomerase A6 homolog [Diabrotica undecimpunctata]|uniref:protein disulfide-isomerase A6 homolog n=1 Tax=Diabrotica undecimpunctata TaxID=50387 RepID=UPI003B63B1CF
MKMKHSALLLQFITILLELKFLQALYSDHKKVIELTPNNFEKLVVKSDEVWVVEFYAPWCGYCQDLVPEYSKAAFILKGVAKVGAVNADKHKELAATYTIRAFPTVKIFGADKLKPEEYKGGKTAKEIAKAALKSIKQKITNLLEGKKQQTTLNLDKEYVMTLTDGNFNNVVKYSDNPWMVLFYAPWCGHCQNLEPHWNAAAKQLNNIVKFGSYDCTVYSTKSKEYRIQGYPTVKLFIPKASPIDYDGGRNVADIVFWVTQKIEAYLPSPELLQIISKTVVLRECEEKNLAVISFLPDILDCHSSCRNSYLNILKNLSVRFKINKWCWLWSEANAQPQIEQVLQIGGSGYPTLVAVDYNNRSFATFVGAFTQDNLYDFLSNIRAGNGHKIPILVKTFPAVFVVDPWDGNDKDVSASYEKVEL